MENRYRFAQPGQYQVFVELEIDDVPALSYSATVQVVIQERFIDFEVDLENADGESTRLVETGELFFFRVESSLGENILEVSGDTSLSGTFNEGDELQLTAPGDSGTFSFGLPARIVNTLQED